MILTSFFEYIPQALFSRMSDIGVLTLATLGIVLIYRTSFTTNFAQGSVASFSAYIMYVLTQALLSNTSLASKPYIIFIISMLVAMVAAFLIGYGIDALIIRRSKNITSNGKQMVTMGMVLVLTALTDIFFSPTISRNIGRIFSGNVKLTIFNKVATISYHNITIFATSIVVIGLVFILLQKTKWGLSVRSTASNELVTQMMGVNTRLITALSWAIAGALGALAAAFWAPLRGQLNPQFMTSVQINAFLALVLGGVTTFIGPVIAAVLIPISLAVIGYFNAVWQNVILYALILLVILILPNGIFGKKVVEKV